MSIHVQRSFRTPGTAMACVSAAIGSSHEMDIRSAGIAVSHRPGMIDPGLQAMMCRQPAFRASQRLNTRRTCLAMRGRCIHSTISRTAATRVARLRVRR